jgi:hypothetical protein
LILSGKRIVRSLGILAELHIERLDPAIDQGVNVADVFFHLLDKLKRLTAFGPHFGDAPLGLFRRILKLSDAIRLWFLSWHVIGVLPGEPSGPPIWRLVASSIYGGKQTEPARS